MALRNACIAYLVNSSNIVTLGCRARVCKWYECVPQSWHKKNMGREKIRFEINEPRNQSVEKSSRHPVCKTIIKVLILIDI